MRPKADRAVPPVALRRDLVIAAIKAEMDFEEWMDRHVGREDETAKERKECDQLRRKRDQAYDGMTDAEKRAVWDACERHGIYP